jgi:hypothetical protein
MYYEILDVSTFIKIHPVGAEFFHVGGQIDMTKPIVPFCNFANAPKKTDFVFMVISNVLQDLPFSQNRPRKSADDKYVRISKN